MKITHTLGLLTLTTALTATVGWSQTTPTGTASPTTYPQGAVAPDSTPASGAGRNQNRANRRNRSTGNRMDQNSQGTTGQTGTNTSTGDAQYRKSSSSNGTSVNSSNTTNYDVNSSVNAPTGAGSNPNATGTPTTPPGNDDTNNSAANAGTANEPKSSAGTAATVTKARMSEQPAVKAGSTERNTSIHDFIASSPNYTTLQNALQSVDLYEKLRGNGPYTLFAPTNQAFKKLPPAMQAGLLEGRNHDALTQLLAYHVVQGTVDAAELNRQIKSGNGKATLPTLAGGILTAQAGASGGITLTDEQGHTVSVEQADQYQQKGVIHTIGAVLMPKRSATAFR